MGVVAVGVDGSDRSVPALEWAVKEAAAHGHTLRVVTAWSIPVTALSPGGLPAPYPIDELKSDGRAAQEAVIAKVEIPEGLQLEHHVVEGGPGAVLLDAAKEADLLVIGSRGHGGFTGLLLGSVGQQLTGHAACPVVVVPTAHH
jgi:nucleotide-binding universal stress UspA family protein